MLYFHDLFKLNQCLHTNIIKFSRMLVLKIILLSFLVFKYKSLKFMIISCFGEQVNVKVLELEKLRKQNISLISNFIFPAFLCMYTDSEVIPKHLRLIHQTWSKAAERMLHRASQYFIWEQIKHRRFLQ